MTKKQAQPLLEQTGDPEELESILYWAGKRGRPVTLRQSAILALVRKHYLSETWEQVTKAVCPCSGNHTRELVRSQCQPKIEAEVRILKRLLRDCKIVLPDEPRVLMSKHQELEELSDTLHG